MKRLSFLDLVSRKHQTGVGPAETEGVGHDPVDLAIVPFGEDVHALSLVHQIVDVGRLSKESLFHHQHAIDRFVV